jgi:hypothetical protein
VRSEDEEVALSSAMVKVSVAAVLLAVTGLLFNLALDQPWFGMSLSLAGATMAVVANRVARGASRRLREDHGWSIGRRK